MERVQINITTESALSLGVGNITSGTLVESAPFISGARLRGVLGGMRRFLSPTEQQEIDELLGVPGRPGIQFPNCYASSGGPAYPLPLTAYTCKRAKGFRSGGHGVQDTLLKQLAHNHVAGTKGEWRVPLPFVVKCGRCGDRTQVYGKTGEHLSGGGYAHNEASSHRQTRVAINRARQTAQEALLYSIKAIDEGNVFVGTTIVEAHLASLLDKWMERTRRIGSRTSRGFGSVHVSTSRLAASSLDHRLECLNSLYRHLEGELMTIAHDPPLPRGHTLFTVNLISPVILRDRHGIATLRFDETMLSSTIGGTAAGRGLATALIAHFVEAVRVSGWQTAWKLPKEVLLAAGMGGLYVFEADTGAPGALNLLLEILEKLEANGIGELREDGFGQVVVCDPFHMEVEPV
jgi:CRISPR-associated protein Csx10